MTGVKERHDNGSRRVNYIQPQSYSTSQQEVTAMTLSQARKRYPSVPLEIVKWALENINDPHDQERGLWRLEQAKQIQVKYAS